MIGKHSSPGRGVVRQTLFSQSAPVFDTEVNWEHVFFAVNFEQERALDKQNLLSTSTC